jgi:uncharacterized membrane protein SirB2
MPLSDYYQIIKSIHIGSIALSGSYFVLRGLWMLAGSPLVNRLLVRVLAPVIDTVLLISAILLVIATRQYPFEQHWLTMKLTALLVYIILGMYALRWGKTRKVQVACFMLASLVFVYIVMVALTRNPLVLI